VVRAQLVAGLGDRDGDQCHLRAAQIVKVGVVIGCRVNRREGADQLERVTLGAADDQGVEAVLGFSASAVAARLPVKPAMPHRSASGLCQVYQA
jgi:hypothetical protein